MIIPNNGESLEKKVGMKLNPGWIGASVNRLGVPIARIVLRFATHSTVFSSKSSTDTSPAGAPMGF